MKTEYPNPYKGKKKLSFTRFERKYLLPVLLGFLIGITVIIFILQ